MNNNYVENFYKEICQELEGDYKIIIEPNRNLTYNWVEYDAVKWELDKPIQKLVEKLIKNTKLTFEEKILKVYEFICLNYIYDDNVLYFFKKDTSDLDNIKYIAVDWYGRIIDEQWKENRKKHNRRICYEFSRFYAKAINELRENENDCEAFMLGDKENLHYVTVLSGKDYSLILDLDDFNKIKDLTRLKLGLTINGIKILRDDKEKFETELSKFNKNRPIELHEVQEIKEILQEKETIKYFRKVLDILRSYSIDSQGCFEYMRAMIEDNGIEVEKIWKQIKDSDEKRHVRCLIFDFKTKTYLLDTVEKTLTEIKKEDLNKEVFITNPEEKQYAYYGG